jgi:4-hydroxybenzoate polyprenyltransferase
MKNFITSVLFFILAALLMVALIQVAYRVAVLLWPYGLIVVATLAVIYAIIRHRKNKKTKALFDKAYQEAMKAFKDAQAKAEQNNVSVN